MSTVVAPVAMLDIEIINPGPERILRAKIGKGNRRTHVEQLADAVGANPKLPRVSNSASTVRTVVRLTPSCTRCVFSEGIRLSGVCCRKCGRMMLKAFF